MTAGRRMSGIRKFVETRERNLKKHVILYKEN